MSVLVTAAPAASTIGANYASPATTVDRLVNTRLGTVLVIDY